MIYPFICNYLIHTVVFVFLVLAFSLDLPTDFFSHPLCLACEVCVPGCARLVPSFAGHGAESSGADPSGPLYLSSTAEGESAPSGLLSSAPPKGCCAGSQIEEKWLKKWELLNLPLSIIYNNEGFFLVSEMNFFIKGQYLSPGVDLLGFLSLWRLIFSNYIKTHSMSPFYIRYFYCKSILNGVIMDVNYTIKSNINQI